MAKLTITFKNEDIKRELEFRGEKYEYKMVKTEYGMTSNKPVFYNQVSDKIGHYNIDDDFLDALDQIDFGNEDDIHNAMIYLSEIE